MAHQILLHVGYHKTATTWLQRAYFPGHPELQVPFNRPQLSKALVHAHPFVFDPDRARELLMERIGPLVDAGKPVVLSNERFTGNPASGGIDAFEIVDRLAQVLPEARVWLQFREQASIINSYYNQFVKQGATCSPEVLLEGNPTHKRIPHFSVDYFHYLPLIKRFEKRFGADRVLCTAFEEFKGDRDNVLGRVGDFAGFHHDPSIGQEAGHVNESLSDRSIRILRVTNGLFPHKAAHRHYRPLLRLRGNRYVVGAMGRLDRTVGGRSGKVKARIRDLVGTYYARSNRDLGAHLGIDLAPWGYPLAEAEPRPAAPAARLKRRAARA